MHPDSSISFLDLCRVNRAFNILHFLGIYRIDIQTFFTTAVAFGALPIWLYNQRDLSGLGNFLFIGLIGIIVASIANWFFQSPVMHLAISAIGF